MHYLTLTARPTVCCAGYVLYWRTIKTDMINFFNIIAQAAKSWHTLKMRGFTCEGLLKVD